MEPSANANPEDEPKQDEPPRPSLLDEVGRAALDEVIDSSRCRPFDRGIPHDQASCLARETTIAALADAPDPRELIDAVASAGAVDAFDQFAAHRRLLRDWAERAAADPFIERCLAAAVEHRADFTKAIGDADRQLDEIRIKHALERRGSGNVAVRRNDDGRLEVVAAEPWAELAKAFPADAKEIHANVAVAELAVGRVRHAASDINRELALFFAELVPQLFCLLERLPRSARRERVGRARLTSGLAATVVEAAQTTDFVADPNLKLGVRRPSLPRRLRLLTTLPEHADVRELIAARRVQTARTVEAGPSDKPDKSE